MFRQVYESEVLEYLHYTQIEQSAFSDPTDMYPDIYYEIPGSPYTFREIIDNNLIAEAINRIMAVYVQRLRNAYSDLTVRVFTANHIVNFPGYGTRLYKLDSANGNYLNEDNDAIATSPSVTPASTQTFNAWLMRISNVAYEADGSLLGTTSSGIRWYHLNMDQLLIDLVGATYYASDYGAVALSCFMIDRKNDVLIRSKGVAAPTVAEIEVYGLTSKELIRSIRVSGIPRQIFPEDANRAFIYHTNGLLNLVNYMTGEVMSTLREPAPIETPPLFNQIGFTRFCYDRFYRRLIAVQLLPNDPETGECTTYARGWYPVPVPVRIMKPIPLVAPRAGRRVPYLTRLFGDAGEVIGGICVTATVDAPGAVITAPAATDQNGETIVYITSENSGSLELTLTAILQ